MNPKILLIIIILVAAMMSGCTTKTNTYVHADNPTEYLELYADNRYVVVAETGFCGTWRIHNDALHLYYDGALLYVLQPSNSGYVDPDGDLWIRP